MAKCLTGIITRLGEPRIKRGDIRFDEIALRDSNGATPVWKKMSMARSVADQLQPGMPATFYYSGAFDTLYGIRIAGGPGVFETWSARWYAPWLSLCMVLAGLATSMFLFPILISLAGFVGILMSIDSRRARSHFRRDGFAAAGRPANGNASNSSK